MKLTEWLKSKWKRKETSEEEEKETRVEEGKETTSYKEPTTEDTLFQKQSIRFEDKQQREQYVRNCCEQMIEASEESENAKLEYNLITAYLNDMQMIEEMPEQQQTSLHSTVRKILNLEEERETLRKTPRKITERQFNYAQSNAEDIPDILKRMVDNEKYREILKSDMQHLENEKAAQNIRKRDLIQEQQNLKGMSLIAFTTLVAVLILLWVFQELLGSNVQLAYLVVMLAAVLVTLGLFLKLKEADGELKYVEKCLNKAIGLLNHTKIKFVNVENALDYSYDKYNVRSAYELNYIWENYLKEKEERSRYQRTNEDIEFYTEQMIRQLTDYGIQDPQVWSSQMQAIIDKKEMEEIRRRLMVRRQKIRKQLDYNNKIMNDAKNEISSLVNNHKQYAREILQIVNSIEG